MLKSRNVLALSAFAALALGMVGHSHSARAEEVSFVCSAPAGHVCQYTIRTAAGPVSFALPSGQRRNVPGITPRQDKFCVCDPGPVTDDCTAPQLGSWCLGYWADVVPGLNSRLDLKGPAFAGR
jgi:hypothetical protein